MALNSGTRLGPYEILASLGAGGMGEVYRAKDTRLGRDVAVKILPAKISADPIARQRFEREARTISGLNHPNICVLHDVGNQDGVAYLVMECLEGETLAARLQKGALPYNDLLRIALDMANALASAHRLGLVHRDLKPSNIMLTKAGAKLMDFGLAKAAALHPASETNDLASAGETLTVTPAPASSITCAGAMVGTIPYMSPEQVEGKEADARSDIFSFGAVLYEMATGHRAFAGKSALSIAAAVLQKEPPAIHTIQPDSPPPLNYTISACLAKDPDDRFQTAHDVKLQLNWLSQAVADNSPLLNGFRRRKSWIAFGVLAATVILVAGLLFAKFRARPATGDAGTARFSILLPPGQELAADATQSVVLSPDGKRLAYVGLQNCVSHLYMRRLDRFTSVEVPDSETPAFPFFSPNGDWIAFLSQGKLKKAPADGGSPVTLCALPSFFGGAWTPQDTIVLAVPSLGLATVPATGGPLSRVGITSPKALYPQGPASLAGGEWVAFTDYLNAERSIDAVNLTTGEFRALLNNAQSPSYADGHLVYFSGGGLWAAPFDAKQIKIAGAAAKIASGVAEANYVAQGGAASNGVLAYAPGPDGIFARSLFLVSRKGVEQKLDVPSQDYVDPAISPDGKHIAFAIRSTDGQEIAVYDRDLRVLTSVVADGGINGAPVWTAEGKELFFDAYNSTGKRGVYRVASSGTSPPQLIHETTISNHVTSAAGGIASMTISDPVTSADLWLLDLNPPFDMHPFKQTLAAERQGALSPDGKWMAYASNESGRSEIYVAPVPGPGGRWQLSSNGGDQPKWVRNGKEIVFRSGSKVLSVAIETQPTFRGGKPVELFDRPFDRGYAVAGYDVSPDGQTFVMIRSEHANPTEIRVVVGWRSGGEAPE